MFSGVGVIGLIQTVKNQKIANEIKTAGRPARGKFLASEVRYYTKKESRAEDYVTCYYAGYNITICYQSPYSGENKIISFEEEAMTNENYRLIQAPPDDKYKLSDTDLFVLSSGDEEKVLLPKINGRVLLGKEQNRIFTVKN